MRSCTRPNQLQTESFKQAIFTLWDNHREISRFSSKNYLNALPGKEKGPKITTYHNTIYKLCQPLANIIRDISRQQGMQVIFIRRNPSLHLILVEVFSSKRSIQPGNKGTVAECYSVSHFDENNNCPFCRLKGSGQDHLDWKSVSA